MIENLREAQPSDITDLCRLDEIARVDADRIAFIRRAIDGRACLVADRAGQLLGYGVLEYTFFGCGFIPLIYVDARYRRRGVGLGLVLALAGRCTTAKLFTSTNESNESMKALLLRAGFVPSGVIHNLDPGDPEIVYFKHATGGQ